MFIDFLTLMLINMAAALFALACYLFSTGSVIGKPHWSPVFAATGITAVVGGFYLIFVFPLPGPYNQLFGETSVLLGMLLLAAALAMAKAWSLVPLSFFAPFGGVFALVAAYACFHHKLTQMPDLTALGFASTGLAGLLIAPILWTRFLRWLRFLAGLLLLLASGIWGLMGFGAVLHHVEVFKNWVPLIMK